MKAGKAMTRDIICIRPEDSLADAWMVMEKLRIRHLPVLDADQKLVGILSDRDVLLRARPGEETIYVPKSPVSEAMTPEPLCCGPDARIADVANMMLQNKIDCVPVVDADDELVGLITSSDLIALSRRDDPVWKETLVPFEYNIKHADAKTIAEQIPAEQIPAEGIS